MSRAYEAYRTAAAAEEALLTEVRHAMLRLGHQDRLVGTLRVLHQLSAAARAAAFDAWREQEDKG